MEAKRPPPLQEAASLQDESVPDVSALSFEQALDELERIVGALEGGKQRLEDAIAAYERGAALKQHCETKLAEAESRVAAIVEQGGSLALRPVE